MMAFRVHSEKSQGGPNLTPEGQKGEGLAERADEEAEMIGLGQSLVVADLLQTVAACWLALAGSSKQAKGE